MTERRAGVLLLALGLIIAVAGVALLPSPWAVPVAIILGGLGLAGLGLLALRGAR